jgi:hypothetical protein
LDLEVLVLRWRLQVLGTGLGDDCGAIVRWLVVGGDEVAVDVAELIFFDSRFSDHFLNLLKFAELVLSC